MDVYFSPLACSLGTRIALYEAGVSARFHEVDPKTKQVLADGSDYFAINPLGLVPALRTQAGDLLTENAVVLQFIADHTDAGLAPPPGSMARYRLQQWLSFVGTELHKAVSIPLLDPSMPDGGKAIAREKAERRMSYLEAHLTGRETLLDGFTVADAYLVTVLNWSAQTKILDLSRWPAIEAYYRHNAKRPSVARALAEEAALYRAELARHKAA